MPEWRLGSMGFSWKDWVGSFYPPGLNEREFLSFYSTVFNAVEIDSTFYGIPRLEVVQHWGEQTTEEFQFSVKMPRLVTHDMKLVGTQEVVHSFLETMRNGLGPKLGAVLIQFPPSFTLLQMPDLKEFLRQLPKGDRFAVEFRHRSWYNEKTEALLREVGVAWAATEYEHLPKRIYRTADFLYIRFIGHHGRFPAHQAVQTDVTPQLEWWRENINSHLEHVETVYGFFNNDYSGFSPATINQFKEMLGLVARPFAPPGQEKLF